MDIVMPGMLENVKCSCVERPSTVTCCKQWLSTPSVHGRADADRRLHMLAQQKSLKLIR